MTNTYLITALAVSGSDLFAATVGEGVFRSSDSGSNWIPVNTGMKSLDIYSVFANGNVLFAGLWDHGVFRSTNKGESWDSIGFYFQNTVAAFAAAGPYIFAASGFSDRSGTVYRSSDNGITWVALDTGRRQESGPVTVLAACGSNLFAGLGLGIHSHSDAPIDRSFDSGTTWVPADQGLNWYDIVSLLVFQDTLYAGTYGDGIWRRPLSEFPNTFGHINASNLYFDDTKVGDTECKKIEIYNIGNGSFTLEKLFTLTGDTNNFSINNQLPALIKPGDSLGITICFHPDSVLLYNEVITWQTDINPDLQNLGNIRTVLYGNGIINSDVKTSSSENVISLSPNPTTGIITVHNAPPNMLHVTIMNVLGETVSEVTNPGTPKFVIDLSKLPPETYFARFSGDGKVISQKIIKE
jgi:hypothetical protein